MLSRKEMKGAARKVLMKHYWLFVVLCLFAGVIGTEFTSSLSATTSMIEEDQDTGFTVKGTAGISQRFTEILAYVAAGKEEESQKLADKITQDHIEKTKANPNTALGRSRGVFSTIINGVTSGSFLVSLAVGLTSVVGSRGAAVMILILLSLLLLFAAWVFGKNLYQVIMRRMVLEGRCYNKVYKQRALFLVKAHKWFRAGITLFVLSVYQTLWMLTIVGGIIKYYSYYLVPYIVAENPGMNSKEAITLSRKLMKGHKWECFVFEMTFIGWDILGALTFGITDIFYTNPYKIAAFSEFYVRLRAQGKEKGIPYSELLNDRYLYERPEKSVLEDAYKDVIQESQKTIDMTADLTGIRKVLSSVFGLTLWNGKKEKDYEENQVRLIRLFCGKEALEGTVYPIRLSPFPEKSKRKWIENVHYIRNYSIWSLVMMFFIMSFVGWLWEVSLHLVTDGEFINRGVLHGPWLPIYGAGSLLILLLLNKFRRNPAMEFVMAVIVCGVVEYFTSYYLEMVHNGKKWWDYSGYFLNLNGRICAEGLLTFGLGGMLIVYVLAPVLDNLIRQIPYKTLIVACLVLICVFAADQIYSKKYPNEGKGITDYNGACLEYKNSNVKTAKTR